MPEGILGHLRCRGMYIHSTSWPSEAICRFGQCQALTHTDLPAGQIMGRNAHARLLPRPSRPSHQRARGVLAGRLDCQHVVSRLGCWSQRTAVSRRQQDDPADHSPSAEGAIYGFERKGDQDPRETAG